MGQPSSSRSSQSGTHPLGGKKLDLTHLPPSAQHRLSDLTRHTTTTAAADRGAASLVAGRRGIYRCENHAIYRCDSQTFGNKRPPGNEPPPIDEKGAVRMS